MGCPRVRSSGEDHRTACKPPPTLPINPLSDTLPAAAGVGRGRGVGITGPPTNIKNAAGNETTQWPSLLNTVTTVKSGETVVLGASKMRGGTVALIVLLTAKLLP